MRGSVAKVHKHGTDVEYWYDRTVRVWYAIRVDTEGYQLGDTLDAYHKEDLLNAVDRGLLAPASVFSKCCRGRVSKSDDGSLYCTSCFQPFISITTK